VTSAEAECHPVVPRRPHLACPKFEGDPQVKLYRATDTPRRGWMDWRRFFSAGERRGFGRPKLGRFGVSSGLTVVTGSEFDESCPLARERSRSGNAPWFALPMVSRNRPELPAARPLQPVRAERLCGRASAALECRNSASLAPDRSARSRFHGQPFDREIAKARASTLACSRRTIPCRARGPGRGMQRRWTMPRYHQ